MISLPSPSSDPPCLIEMYLSVPELSASSLPPYEPNVKSAGTPSICALTTSTPSSSDAEILAFPNTINPPQSPESSVVRLVPEVDPSSILSVVDVKTIGAEAVPTAFIFPPMPTISAEDRDPVPGEPFIIVPASIVKVTPSAT